MNWLLGNKLVQWAIGLAVLFGLLTLLHFQFHVSIGAGGIDARVTRTEK